MSPSDDQTLTGAIFDESAVLSLKDLSRMCSVDERHIVQFVEEGVLNVIEVRSDAPSPETMSVSFSPPEPISARS